METGATVEAMSKLGVDVDNMTTHEDIIKSTADRVLERDIPWEGYQRANLILEKELELIKKYDKKSDDYRNGLITKDGPIYAELFLELLVKINKEETLQYLLTLVDKLLTDRPESVNLFYNLSAKNSSFPFVPFIRLLNRTNFDWYTNAKASVALTVLMSKAPESQINADNVKFMCNWFREQFKKIDEKEVSNGVNALQKFLQRDSFRSSYATEDGLQLLASLLKKSNKNFQFLYQTIRCIWLLSYNHEVGALLTSTKIIPNLVEVLKNTQREKVTRLALATLRNLLNISRNNEAMIDAGIMRPLDNFSARNWGDEDIVADLQVLRETLQKNLVALSSFEIYRKEVLSGNLEWTPVHRSEKFWKENAFHMEEDNNKVLLVLKELLSSGNPLVLAVAAYDLGEFARIHARGKILIQQLGIKLPLMALMEHTDNDVKKHAILAVQKVMVHNWEYLTR